MGFLDRFKPQPRWKHTDPAIRAAAVEALPDDEQALLQAIALEDTDPGVRRTALGRVSQADILARIARDDADESVKSEARELVLGLARDATDVEIGRQALAGLADSRELAIVARSGELEDIAADALARLDEPRVIGVVARQASHANVRLAALARLTSRDDLLTVALKSEHRDVATAALSRLTDRDALELVAVRSRNKVASRRARSALRVLEETERAPRRQAERRQQVIAHVSSLTRSSDLAKAEAAFALALDEWNAELAESAAPEESARFEAAGTTLRELLSRSEAERAEHERRAHALAEEMGQAARSRVALCEKVEQLAGEHAAAGLDEARMLWVTLVPWPESVAEGPEARSLQSRFERAAAECERRMAQRAADGARQTSLAAIVEQADQAAAVDDLNAARGELDAARRAWQQSAGAAGVDPALLDRFRAAEERLLARERDARERRSRAAAQNLARLDELAARADALAATAEPAIKDVERTMRDLRSTLDHPGAFPSKADHDRIVERLRTAHAALYPRLQELRDAEEWRRWANATVQEELCAKVEALKTTTDLAEAAKGLRDLQQQWKKVGTGPREQGDALWLRFKAASDDVRAKCESYFDEQKAAEAANLQAKEQLCVQAEALVDSTDWIRTADELKRLQSEWQKSGPVSHDRGRALWQRFRTACDRFFTRRKEDLSKRKHVWAENAQKKEAICARAEELAASTDWDTAANELKRLQIDWKAIGPVKKQRSEALWLRFRKACDTFFERYKQRDQNQASRAVSAREAVCVELEALAPAEGAPAAAPVEVSRLVLDVWQRWQQAPRAARPAADGVQERFDAALSRVLQAWPDAFRGTRLDVTANLDRMESLCAQVETMAEGSVRPTDLAATAPETLATMLKDALASNTIGGRVDEDAKRRAAVATVRDAQQHWRRLGPVPTDRGRELAARFHRACRRFFEQTPTPA